MILRLLTFDIEEWFVYEQYPKGGKEYFLPIINELLDDLLNILDSYNHKATFFCLGIIAREYPDVIKRIAHRGHEIACHSDRHIWLNEMTPDDFEKDLQLAVQSLESVINSKIISYRAPAFSIGSKNKWVFDILSQNDIQVDCSIFPATRSGGGYNNFNQTGPVIIKTLYGDLLELPVNIYNYSGFKIPFSGGGYFRLLPYSLISRMANKSEYIMSYFHLRDFDTKQKVVISWRYFKSYYGIKQMLPKLKRFLADYEFSPVNAAFEKLQKSTPKVIEF